MAGKYPMLFFPHNYCTNCKTNSIELFSWHNYAQRYQKLLNDFEATGIIPESFDKYAIYTMRCTRCGKEYKIRWREDGLPVPIRGDTYPTVFRNTYISESIKGRPHVLGNVYTEGLKEFIV